MDQHREKLAQAAASYLGAPALGYAVTHLATHDLTNYTSFDNANEISLFAGLALATSYAALNRKRVSRWTFPLVTGVLTAAAALATQHSDLMTEAWAIGGTGAFLTESLARGRRASRKPGAPRK